MHLSIEILLLMIVSCGFMDIEFFQPLVRNNMNVVTNLLLLVYVFIRNMGFTFKSGIAGKLKPMWWLLAGVLISFIPAYLYYGQHLYNSLTAYRHFLGYFAFFLFLSVQPTRYEFKKASYFFAFIYIVCVFYCSFINPDFVYFDPDSKMPFITEGEFIHVVPGFHFLMIAYIFALDDIRNEKITFKSVAILFLILAIIFLVQNRTVMFSAFVIGVFSAMAGRSHKQRLTIGTLLVVALCLGVFFTWKYIDLLITETIDELTDEDYNRVKAFIYFTSGDNGTMSYFWGNGFISGKVHPIMEQLREEGIFNSDLGLIGFWHQFGLIPVITILVVCFKGLSKMRSFEVRANALNILLCSLTIAYFRDFPYSLWLCIYWYLYSIDPVYDYRKRIHDAEVAQRAMRRFRSLTR